jgi:hypothetical protein
MIISFLLLLYVAVIALAVSSVSALLIVIVALLRDTLSNSI